MTGLGTRLRLIGNDTFHVLQFDCNHTAMKLPVLIVVSLVTLVRIDAEAGTATWLANPSDNNWNNSDNWSSGKVPGGSDEALFEDSIVTNISVFFAGGSVGSITFQENAAAYTITATPGVIFPFGSFVENDSGFQQNFIAAADSDFSAGFVFGIGTSIAGPVTFTEQGTSISGGPVGYVIFTSPGTGQPASAGDATFHNLAGAVSGAGGGQMIFSGGGATAAEATIVNDGASVSGATGGATYFYQETVTAGNATLVANSGSNGGGGGFLPSNPTRPEEARVWKCSVMGTWT